MRTIDVAFLLKVEVCFFFFDAVTKKKKKSVFIKPSSIYFLLIEQSVIVHIFTDIPSQTVSNSQLSSLITKREEEEKLILIYL